MLAFKSPSNRVTLEITGVGPLDADDAQWLRELTAGRLDRRLIDAQTRPAYRVQMRDGATAA